MLPTKGGGGETYLQRVLSFGPLVYWPLVTELTGTNADNAEGTAARDGTYNADVSGWPTRATGPYNGSAPTFDGTEYVNIYTPSLAANWTPGVCTVCAYGKMSAWGDSVGKIILSLGYDGSANYLTIGKGSALNQTAFIYFAGGTIKYVQYPMAITDWVHYAMTVDMNAGASGEMKAFVDGVQVGSTQTGLGTWASAPIDTRCVIGAFRTTPSSAYYGNIAHVAIFNAALTPTQIAQLP